MTEETLRIGNSWMTVESDDEPAPDDNPLRQLDEIIRHNLHSGITRAHEVIAENTRLLAELG